MPEFRPLDLGIFRTEDILALAKSLLGKSLISHSGGKRTAGKIVELEAYKAPEDKASHAYGNKRTPRTSVMFGPPGHAYVYLCYGIHRMFNIVSGPEGTAHAILVRALEPLEGIDHMIKRRKKSDITSLCNGPGKLCQAMDIGLHYNGSSIMDPDNALWLADGPAINKSDIHCSPRVGIAYAEECAHWPWRFKIRNNPFCSLPDEVRYIQ